MKVFRQFPAVGDTTPIRHLCIGFFDGIHRGHLEVIRAFAPAHDLRESCLVTFWPHPQSILFPDAAPRLLMGLDHKLKALKDLGLAATLVVPFDLDFADLSADAFHEAIGRSFPALERVSVGPNFRYGARRSGTPARLSAWCHQRLIEFRSPPLLAWEGAPVSSSRIRAAVAGGSLEEARAMLGYPFTLCGRVVHGDKRGRRLGYPTINLQTEPVVLPPDGVYAGTVTVTGMTRKASIHIGARPTVDTGEAPASIEAHLLDFTGDLYGESVLLSPQLLLRHPQRFTSIDALREQIADDVRRTRAMEWGGLA